MEFDKQKFLVKLEENCGSVSAACRALGTSRRPAYYWRDRDEQFARAWDETIASILDELEKVATLWAMTKLEGVTPSASLTMFFLRSRLPEKYGNRATGNTSTRQLLEEFLKAQKLMDQSIPRVEEEDEDEDNQEVA